MEFNKTDNQAIKMEQITPCKQNFIYIAFAIGLLLLGCSSNKKKTNDLTQMNLHGKVISLKEFSYEPVKKKNKILTSSYSYTIFNEKGNIIEVKSYNSDEILKSKITYKYDEKENVIEMNYYKSDESQGKKWIYKYNKKGDVFEANKYNSSGILELNLNIISTYDEKGNLIDDRYYSNNSNENLKKTTYKHDGKGNLVELNKYNSDGSLAIKKTYKYDEKGNVIEENEYNSNGILIKKFTGEYNEEKNLLKKKIEYNYNSDGSLHDKWINKYDEKGNLFEANIYHSDGNSGYKSSFLPIPKPSFFDKKYRYEYKFDKQGNWTKRIEFLNKKTNYIFEREIKYY